MSDTNTRTNKIIEDKTKYNINNDKKMDLINMKNNIIEFGHYLKNKNITNGPLYKLFNEMYDNYNIMLQSFNKQHNNILKNLNIKDNNRFKMKNQKKKMNTKDEFDNIILNLNKVNKSLNSVKNIKLTKKDIDNIFINNNDYVNIGKNEDKDNVFKRNSL